jgi:hypothetical protein
MPATLTRRLRRAAVGAVCAAAVALPFSFASADVAQAAQTPQAPRVAGFTSLKLLHGWTNTDFRTAHPSVRAVSGIVQFKGAMSTSGTSDVAFTLPKAFRPATAVYVPVNMCGSAEGRLLIEPNGKVLVDPENQFSDAQCFTSLDGVSFARSASGFHLLKLANGWKNAPFSTSRAGARVISGIVHLKGAIFTNGTNQVPFTLPKAFRPASNTYVNVDLCNAHNGRLVIRPSGLVTVQVEDSFSNAQCFTSLDGATFARSGSSFTSLKLINGWKNRAFSTATVGARNISGDVELRGAMSTSGTNDVPFTLPKAFRPGHNVYVAVDLCNAHFGRVLIETSGEVIVEVNSETSTWADAQCFTSLEGVSFAR